MTEIHADRECAFLILKMMTLIFDGQALVSLTGRKGLLFSTCTLAWLVGLATKDKAAFFSLLVDNLVGVGLTQSTIRFQVNKYSVLLYLESKIFSFFGKF